jgi:uncharacterized membrane protein
MAAAGVIGGVCAAILTIDKIELLQNPDANVGCSVSVFVDCAKVVNQPQASAFGFPNTIIGLIAFGSLVTLGVLLAAGLAFPRWVWGGLQAGLLFGIGFVTWLQYQSIHVLHVLCPYCMVVWAVMIPLFVIGTAACLRELAPGTLLTRVVNEWRALIVGLWFVVVLAAIWFQFGTALFNR